MLVLNSGLGIYLPTILGIVIYDFYFYFKARMYLIQPFNFALLYFKLWHSYGRSIFPVLGYLQPRPEHIQSLKL